MLCVSKFHGFGIGYDSIVAADAASTSFQYGTHITIVERQRTASFLHSTDTHYHTEVCIFLYKNSPYISVVYSALNSTYYFIKPTWVHKLSQIQGNDERDVTRIMLT